MKFCLLVVFVSAALGSVPAVPSTDPRHVAGNIEARDANDLRDSSGIAGTVSDADAARVREFAASGAVNEAAADAKYAINSQNPWGSGLEAAVNVFGDVLQEYQRKLEDSGSSPVWDTFYAAIGGMSRELSVVAVTFRNILDPTDWDTVHTIGRLLSPIVEDASRSAASVANNLQEHGLGESQSYASPTDRLNGLQTYVSSLRDISEIAQTYDIDNTPLNATISHLEALLRSYSYANTYPEYHSYPQHYKRNQL